MKRLFDIANFQEKKLHHRSWNKDAWVKWSADMQIWYDEKGEDCNSVVGTFFMEEAWEEFGETTLIQKLDSLLERSDEMAKAFKELKEKLNVS